MPVPTRIPETRRTLQESRSRLVNAIPLEPTFPIDESRIRQRYRMHLRQSPRSIGWMIIGRLASWTKKLKSTTIGKLAEWGAEGWNNVHQSLTLRAFRELASESNRDQDAAISTMMNELLAASHLQYAISLGKFLLLKQRIELELHSDGSIDERRQYLERLVDSVCHEVCFDIYQLSQANSSLSQVLTSGSSAELEDLSTKLDLGHSRILHAYQTLSEIASQLAVLLKPGATNSRNEEARELDRLLEVLKSESKMAQIVDERVRSELPRI